jgi:hypothetical protein
VSFKGLNGEAYDYRHRFCTSAYSVYPQLFVQSNSLSNLSEDRHQLKIHNSILNKLIKFCSWYALHVGEKIALVFCVLVLIMLICTSKKHNQ